MYLYFVQMCMRINNLHALAVILPQTQHEAWLGMDAARLSHLCEKLQLISDQQINQGTVMFIHNIHFCCL